MIQVFHLSAPGCSKRAVKIRELTSSEVDQCRIDSAKMLGADSTNAEYGIGQQREMNHRAIVAVSKTPLTSQNEVVSTEWTPLTPLLLAEGACSYDKIFTAKDDSILSAIIKKMHVASMDDIDSIVGKALTVSED